MNHERLRLDHEKNLFDKALLSFLREKIVNEVKDHDLNSVSDREKGAILRGESSDKQRMQSVWYDVWRNHSSIDRLLSVVHPFNYVMFPVQVRQVKASDHHVPWHQDIGYMLLLGDKAPKQVITCFIPLEENPADCTTLQFCLDNVNDEHPKTLKHDIVNAFGAGIVDKNFNELTHFNLNLGDALIFGDHIIHRTFLPEGCKPNRRSLEFRLLKKEHLLPNRDYFDIAERKFIKTNEKAMVMEASVLQ
jgi:ectoine hydroxylase-related dioxygenase (phytanoyl-CoA dioxygenase family)